MNFFALQLLFFAFAQLLHAVPRTPLPCAAGLFSAKPLHIRASPLGSSPFSAVAGDRIAAPRHCISSQNSAIPLPCIAFLAYTVAKYIGSIRSYPLQNKAILFLAIASLFHAIPLRRVSRQCHSHAVISNSELYRCGANHVVSMQFHCVSIQFFASPRLAFAQLLLELPCLCKSRQISASPLLRSAKRCLALAFPCASRLCRCKALRFVAKPRHRFT